MSYTFTPGSRILRRPDVRKTTGLSDSALNRLMSAGDFPKPIQLGARAVGWPDFAVYEWLNNRTESTIEFAK